MTTAYAPAEILKARLPKMSDQKLASMKPKNETLAKVLHEEKIKRSKVHNAKPHPGLRELTVNGVAYLYKVGRKFVEVRSMHTAKAVYPKYEIIGMTEKEWMIMRRQMDCDTCGDSGCPKCRVPLNVSITPAKLAAFLSGVKLVNGLLP